MAMNPSNNSNLEQLALKGLKSFSFSAGSAPGHHWDSLYDATLDLIVGQGEDTGYRRYCVDTGYSLPTLHPINVFGVLVSTPWLVPLAANPGNAIVVKNRLLAETALETFAAVWVGQIYTAHDRRSTTDLWPISHNIGTAVTIMQTQWL